MRTTFGEAAIEAALEHLGEAAGQEVRGGRDRAAAAHQHHRVEVRIVAAEHREVFSGSCQHDQSVGVDAAHGLLDPGHVLHRGQLEQRLGAEAAARAVGDVVDDERHRRALRHRLEVADDRRLGRAHVVGDDGERGACARYAGERLVTRDRGASVVRARPDHEHGPAVRADPCARGHHGVALPGVERGRLTRGCERDDPRGTGVDRVHSQALEGVDVDAAVLRERRDERHEQAGGTEVAPHAQRILLRRHYASIVDRR